MPPASRFGSDTRPPCIDSRRFQLSDQLGLGSHVGMHAPNPNRIFIAKYRLSLKMDRLQVSAVGNRGPAANAFYSHDFDWESLRAEVENNFSTEGALVPVVLLPCISLL